MPHPDLRTDPYPWLAVDGLFPTGLLREAHDAWPAADWPGWVGYEPPRGHKRASDLTTPLPLACGELLHRMAQLEDRLRYWFSVADIVADLGLWGAGLHEMGPGGDLPLHLDADRHARLSLARVLSVVLYVHSTWHPGWGGALELSRGSGRARAAIIEPLPGRLVAFKARDAWHAVTPVTCPAGCRRLSLALFFYGPPMTGGGRPRAHFAG